MSLGRVIMTNQHLVTFGEETYAAAIEDEQVVYARLVSQPEEYLLDQQVEEAKLSYDNDQAVLCEILTDMRFYGEAVEIGAYFEVNVG